MDGGLTLTWLIVLLVIISLHNSRWVSGTFHENQSSRRKLEAKEGFTDTGINYNVSEEYVYQNNDQHLKNVRSFPEGDRNCYTLWPRQGKNHKYLIRARFLYGNYDSKNQLPIFKLYLGVDEWTIVNIGNVTSTYRKEIIHIPITDYIDVCLVNVDSGTPFISVLELRRLNDSIYSPTEPGSLILYDRWDFGTQQEEWKLIREKDDVYDRIWKPFTWWSWLSISSSLVSSSFSTSDYKLPGIVMATAAKPANESESWGISLSIDDDPSQKLYMYMHFAEVEDLKGQIREFTVSVNDEPFSGPVAPRLLFSDTVSGKYSISGSTTKKLSFSLERTNRSTLPPIINAMEAYMIREFPQSSTQQNDVDAIKRIKSHYAVGRNWQGDPCLPMEYQWDGLTCSHNTSPTIISLNLSSSNLSGNILPSFSSLKSLQNLDLSYNNLTGPVPKFLADLPSLTILNLKGNNLTGSVPQAVNDKFKDGTLSLGENPNLCLSDSCQGKKKKKKKFLVPVLISVLSAIVILILIAAFAIIRKLTNRRETKATTIETVTERPKEGSLKSGNSEFTFSDVASITNNFSRTIGRGGFGQVYLGTLADGTQVAVKVRSESSIQGPKALRAEAKLLTRVHHKNLVRLIGYCKDGTHMALIYEYMSNGNLQNKLLGREAADVLNWKRRLQIAVDAAHGLEYLHNGCKPPIVHRDMKSSNILLNETLEAKIADFGMSRDLESGAFLSTDPVGTPGYLDPEYQSTGNLNKKSDVYGFGIVLLELITGQPAIKNPGRIHIVGWVSPMIERGDIQSIVDPRLQGDFNTNSAWKAVEIALACVASTGMQRPDMSHVLADLKECLGIEVASRRIQSVGSHSIGSGNFLEDSPWVLSTQSAPHAR
ncbi:putative leucine-rich repeat receptor-like serine/threonine-protein kinase At2g19230 isoform X2 [Vitis riparia]|uniref:putative leucine-rich repeat receptor-like serine/threonine-protein kinase At2g19230 isoform X2 n=1 Tax=Vitis riparia TaxID=96939 RepID=UPI00155AB873|nr:putative leucine-rich repeat receptor-like serine/threonine-protein kinase At2g19230 isoform X2 [Vitis riparia]